MNDFKLTPIRIQPVINTPFRIWALFTCAILAVIIAINAD